MTIAITAIAHYVPPRTLTNSDLERRLDTSDAWIREHTGISTRHFAESGGTSELAAPAVARCLSTRSYQIDDIDCLIVATSTPDYLFPSTAAIVLRKLGATKPWGFDVSAACSGFLYALSVGTALIRSQTCRRVVVCGAERLTSITDYTDRLTAVLFGDAAAALLLESSEDAGVGIFDVDCQLRPVAEELLYQHAGGSAHPATVDTVGSRQHYLSLDGRAVFRSAVDSMVSVTCSVMERHRLGPSDIDWFVPHQANLRIIKEVASRLGVPMERVMVNLDRYGNTSAASIPLCLSEWHAAGRIDRGANVILASFGAGFTMASAYLRWSLESPSGE